MLCAVKLPATVIAHFPPKKAGSAALPERPVAAGSTDLSTWIMSCICLITFWSLGPNSNVHLPFLR